jgi:hypothetical protein
MLQTLQQLLRRRGEISDGLQQDIENLRREVRRLNADKQQHREVCNTDLMARTRASYIRLELKPGIDALGFRYADAVNINAGALYNTKF